MSTSSKPAALVTNCTGYAGPPTVDALGEAGFRVLVRPGEIGELIRFLATTQARFLTGAIIDFNGAWPGNQVRPT
ncbi:hypothetical protein [Paraburkholderia sp. GAS334]|uniref:hypothetical protein n=1 Tax=Paraburkholderia sp. GAS334 TaxID=3035131 RepID=UPI003D1EA756